MSARLLIFDAASPATSNLIRSLKAGDPSLVIVGCSDSPFFLQKSNADLKYLLPAFSSDFARDLQRVIEAERIDLVIPTSDAGVLKLSRMRDELGGRIFLPGESMLEQCQDKYTLGMFLRERGIPVPLTHAIPHVNEIEAVFRQFPSDKQLWCRVRAGSGSYAAIPVKRPEQVRSWIAYWEEMRFVSPDSFTLSEYLPGRDFCVQCLWDDGRLVLAKMAERITYLDTGSPSGVSSMPALAKTVYLPEVIEVSVRAIRELDARARGVYFVDLKQNEDGIACITEINAGRVPTMTNIHDLTGAHNMALLYVRLALGEKIEIPGASDYVEDYYLVRSVDTLPAVIRGEELFRDLRQTNS